MSGHVLALTYHAVGAGEGPLYVDRTTLATHLDCIVESGARAVTVSELADTLRSGPIQQRTVAITFDDGFASVARVAAPLLEERRLRATVFCVAGHLGGTSDWPSALPDAPRHELARADELAELARAGWEIGCHGMTHAPLVDDSCTFLDRELLEAKARLEGAVGVPVRSFAYPYGAAPSRAARQLVVETYTAACSTRLGYVDAGADPWALPRVDAHYLRWSGLLRAALSGALGFYLSTRGLGARARRVVRRDYAVAGEAL
jgi:peptidoglycan/xylan/chitin deacetylase (PgdA/CDA1 family)